MPAVRRNSCTSATVTLTVAMRYALDRWLGFTLFIEDSRGAIDNNLGERAVKPVVLGGVVPIHGRQPAEGMPPTHMNIMRWCSSPGSTRRTSSSRPTTTSSPAPWANFGISA